MWPCMECVRSGAWNCFEVGVITVVDNSAIILGSGFVASISVRWMPFPDYAAFSGLIFPAFPAAYRNIFAYIKRSITNSGLVQPKDKIVER